MNATGPGVWYFRASDTLALPLDCEEKDQEINNKLDELKLTNGKESETKRKLQVDKQTKVIKIPL